MIRELVLLLFVALSACSGGGDATSVTPTPSNELSWDNGNWNEKNWN